MKSTDGKQVVNGLWIQGKLSAPELLTIHSFTAHGFAFRLWTYEPDSINIPENTEVRNAADIIPMNEVFSYDNPRLNGLGKGSYAGFSDIFRYKLLYDTGGIWADMDITCLKAFDLQQDYFFRYHHKTGAVGNFMKCPPNSPVMQWCYDEARKKIDAQNDNWMLPISILNEGIARFGLGGHIQKISNNDSFPEVAKMLSSDCIIPDNWLVIHWMNEEWRRMHLSKTTFLPGSVFERLLTKYAIEHDVFKKSDLLKNKLLLSRYYYLLVNIRAALRLPS